MAKLSIFIFSLLTLWPALACSQSTTGKKIQSSFYPRIRVAQNQVANPQNQSDFLQTANKQTGPFGASPSQVKTVATRLKGFGIPFQLNSSDSFIEVQLYLSRDMGQTWSFQGRQTTDRQEFPFEAGADGEYWFSIKTLNRDRKLLPEGDPQAELKIIVDTVKPKLEFRIEADAAGRVVCRWLAQDKNIVPETMQIYYQPIADGVPTKDWIRVPIELDGSARNGTYSDQIAWWPETSERTLNVAAQISDISGNSEQLFRQVIVAPSAWRHRQNSTARITDTPRASTPISKSLGAT